MTRLLSSKTWNQSSTHRCCCFSQGRETFRAGSNSELGQKVSAYLESDRWNDQVCFVVFFSFFIYSRWDQKIITQFFLTGLTVLLLSLLIDEAGNQAQGSPVATAVQLGILIVLPSEMWIVGEFKDISNKKLTENWKLYHRKKKL